MSYQTNIQWLDGGRILAECGPMRLVIAAWLGGIPQRELCIHAAEEAFRLLERIARHRRLLSRRYQEVPNDLDNFQAVKMIRSVLAVDQTLTPMAAVAGTIADGVATFLSRRGMTRVIVNNGGDVAIRTGEGESVKVGIRPVLSHDDIADIVTLGDERPSWGVATSGLQGRSLTRGVASAATIIAGSASLADAAATSVANASYVNDETVIQRSAEELDDQTDIPGIAVTVQAGPFTEEKKTLALSVAMKKAEAFIKKGLIYGAYIVVDGKVMMTDFIRHRLKLLKSIQ
jgi:ApbE superfamily uncharacterized protein (UPF0280 family)